MAEAALKLVETIEEKALTVIDQRALSYAEKTKSLPPITTNQEYITVGEIWKAGRELLKELDNHYDDLIKDAHLLHKKAVAKKAMFYVPTEAAVKAAKQLMSTYDAEQEKIRKAEEERLAAIARAEEEARRKAEIERLEADRKAEEDRLLAEAQAAKDRGDNDTAEILTNAAVETSEAIKEQTAAIAQEPIYIAPVVAPKTTPKMTGGPVYQTRWYAEVVDIKALCMAVGTGKTNPEYVMGLERDKVTGKISSSILDKMAPTAKDVFPIAPGVKAYSKRV